MIGTLKRRIAVSNLKELCFFRILPVFVLVLQLAFPAGSLQAAESPGKKAVVNFFLEMPQELQNAKVIDSPMARESFLREHHLSSRDVEALHAAKRFRTVTINEQALEPRALVKGTTLYLGLFHDVVLQATVVGVQENVNGVSSVMARVKDSEAGYVLLSIADGKVLGSIRLPEYGWEFELSTLPGLSGHILQEVDPAQKDELMPGPPLIPPGIADVLDPLSSRLRLQADTGGDMGIDLMIVYTPAAEDWAEANAGSIEHVIGQVMSRAQIVLDNSRVGITVRLVHSARILYTESGDSFVDIERFSKTDDGYMDEVHDWRDTYGADVVSLLAHVSDVGGLGWLLNDRDGSPNYAFNLNRVQQSHNTYTVIHEIGHNMGAHHHKEQNVEPGPMEWWNWEENTWSAGWRWNDGNDDRYCSVMTYEDGRYFPDGLTHVRVPYFSNPEVVYEGEPTGHATHGDNARTLREIKNVIANYRSDKRILHVNSSSNAPGVAVTANPETYAGTTDYSRAGIPGGTTITLVAPETSGSNNFAFWTGCDFTDASARTCTLTMNTDKMVIVSYAGGVPKILPGVLMLLQDDEQP